MVKQIITHMKWVKLKLAGFFQKPGHCFAPLPTLDSPPPFNLKKEGLEKRMKREMVGMAKQPTKEELWTSIKNQAKHDHSSTCVYLLAHFKSKRQTFAIVFAFHASIFTFL